MTVNGFVALILRYFTEFGIASGAHCVKVLEDVVVKKFTFAVSSPDEFLVFWQPIVKRLAVRYRTVVCLLFVCPVRNVGVLWPSDWNSGGRGYPDACQSDAKKH